VKFLFKDTSVLEALILDGKMKFESDLIASIKFSIGDIQNAKETNGT
jgi:hypothetical protein